MANTRQSLKRSHQEQKRQLRNQRNRSVTKTVVNRAIQAIQKKDLAAAKDAFFAAIAALDSAASKGALPKARASRKISRMTHFAKKVLPELFAR